jgi:hypothetical protein
MSLEEHDTKSSEAVRALAAREAIPIQPSAGQQIWKRGAKDSLHADLLPTRILAGPAEVRARTR